MKRTFGGRTLHGWARVAVVLSCMGLLLPSCVPPQGTAPQAPPPATTQAPPYFRSEEFIVYPLKGDETPASLARQFLGSESKAWVIEEANEGIPFSPGQFVVIPLKAEHKGGLWPEGYQTVPILCYHRFAPSCRSSLCVSASLFEDQMRYLKENGYHVIPMRDLMGFLQYQEALPQRALVLTIDDGYRSAYEIAFPILRRYGFSATLFIYTDFVGASRGALTWEQLREMKVAGFEIGSHTLSHCDLTRARKGEQREEYLERIRREIFESKRILDTNLGQDTLYLAFPYGRSSPEVVRLCREAGYRMGLSVKGRANPFFVDPMGTHRKQVLHPELERFARSLDTFHEMPLR